MRRVWLYTILLGLWTAAGLTQTTEELVNDGKDSQNVTTESMGYSRNSYSPLNQINKSNVKRLVPLWSTSLANDQGELAAPTVYNGVLYVVNGKWSFAIDVETGAPVWRTPVELESGVTHMNFNRGAATIYHGKLFRVTIDNHILALDMKTGKELWNQKFADLHDGYYATGGPIVANGVLISGVSGGESTTRGFLDGWDPDTGKKLWRRYTIPAPGEPGSETWPKNTSAWSQGGGPTWRSGSYDPQLDLVYWGTGNAEPYDPRPREGLDSLFTNSVLAIRPKTGEVVCYYQYTPNDVYDVDATDENVLADMRVDGQLRKVMIQANKNGFLYVLDRTNCKLIAAHPYVKVNWATEIDLATGRPVLTDVYKRFVAGEEVEIWPSRGTNAVPIAFDPNTGLIYASTWNIPRIQRLAAPKPSEHGKDSTGVAARIPVAKPGDVVGHFVAIDPLTGEKKWEIPLTDLPSSAGMLATGGGLVFTGKLTGEFLALDEDTGQTLWQFKTGSSVNSTAITYTHNGRQYVTVVSGLGGQLATRYAARKVPAGGSVWTFALFSDSR
ncbi:MAG TPA: PQQ-dependent dehydrogenase, methanol/ethanol family [Bryobacteraceae bacterium]|nr:PQQ-dependent dehydrogenase, methanol/ethanol family [Bryobacteraceae bacterium]HUO30540.1 PQQ-dependent dehydrogenase, methanol/ethanol family [Bryobacteraceae bacterium]